MTVRTAMTAWLTLVLVLVGLMAARAGEREEATVTVQVSSADHEMQEGYFTLGDSITLMVKPGSELHRFLSRQRGRKIKLSITDTTTPGLSRLQR